MVLQVELSGTVLSTLNRCWTMGRHCRRGAAGNVVDLFEGTGRFMPTNNEIPAESGENFRTAAGFGVEDAQLRGLRYHLLRLTAIKGGLAQDDVRDLSELGRLAFEESEVTGQVRRIKARPGSSRLAVAIADIVEMGSPRGTRREVMMGAVLGSYASLGRISGVDELLVATIGAIAGAVAVTTNNFIGEINDPQSWSHYLDSDE